MYLVHLSFPGPPHLEVHISSPGTNVSTTPDDSRFFDQVADHWYPKESQAQARVDEYLEWQHLGTRSILQSKRVAVVGGSAI